MIPHIRSVFNMAPRRLQVKRGTGVLNKLIDLLPFEAHIPGGYRYCGPGTKLQTRLARGDLPINGLDAACKEHDVRYSQTSDTRERNKADLALADQAWQRVKAGDSSLGERAAAYAVTNSMKLKAKLGMGCRKSQLGATTAKTKQKHGGGCVKRKKKQQHQKKRKKKQLYPEARVIPLPKTGAGDVRTILEKIGLNSRSVVPATKKIRTAISGGPKEVRIGKGLYLRPFHAGYGLYLRPYAPDLN